MDPFSGVVLTGGASRRMGADKALVTVDGRPMAVRVADALRRAGAAEGIPVGGALEALGALGLDAVADPHQGEGPLAGILAALAVVTHDVAVIVATDMAWLEPATIVALGAALADPAAAAAVARAERIEPLCAAWRVGRCRSVVEARYAEGERAVHRVLATLGPVEVLVPAHTVANANTPADLRR